MFDNCLGSLRGSGTYFGSSWELLGALLGHLRSLLEPLGPLLGRLGALLGIALVWCVLVLICFFCRRPATQKQKKSLFFVVFVAGHAEQQPIKNENDEKYIKKQKTKNT